MPIFRPQSTIPWRPPPPRMVELDPPVPPSATGGFVMPAFTMAASPLEVFSATAAFLMPSFIMGATANEIFSASVGFVMPTFIMAASATETVSATAAFVMPTFVMGATESSTAATGSFVMPSFIMSATASSTAATAAFVMPTFIMGATATEFVTASAGFIMPAFVMASSVTITILPATAAQIAAALSGQYGPIVLSFSLTQVDQFNNAIADCTLALLDGTVTLNNDAAVARTAKLHLDPAGMPAGFASAPYTRRNLNLAVTVLTAGGPTTFGLGLFHADIIHKTNSAGAELWDVDCSDFCIVLVDRTITSSYVVPAGSNYMAAVQIIVSNLGYNASALPPVAAVTPVDFVWTSGATWMAICGDLLYGLNYYDLWADASGAFQTRARIDPAAETSVVTYSSTTEPIMVVPPLVRSVDPSRFANSITVSIDDPLRTPVTVPHTNADPTSPISTVTTGKPIQVDIKGNGGTKGSRCVLNAQTCSDIGAFELKELNTRAQPADLVTFFDPRRGNREYVSLQIDALEVNTLWRVVGWTFSFSSTSGAGVMKHTLGKALAVGLS